MEVNFLNEVTAFETWLESHELSISAQLLWHKLMYLSSQNEWKEVMINNLNLMKTMQMGREATLIKTKEELVQAGLIEFEKGKKGSPNRYRILFFEEKNTCKLFFEEKSIKAEEQKESIPSPALIKRFEEFWMIYPKKVRRFLTEQAYADLISHNSEEISEEKIISAAKNYANECEILKLEYRLIKMPCNWLSGLVWVDYLPENYKEPESVGRKIENSRFNNISARKYDYEELEKALLGTAGN